MSRGVSVPAFAGTTRKLAPHHHVDRALDDRFQLLARYLSAAKEIAEHVLLLPDGYRFSSMKTRRDWTAEGTAKLRAFYRDYAADDGRLPVQPYLAATVRHREALRAGKVTIDNVAAKEKVHPKYLGILWQMLTEGATSAPKSKTQRATSFI